MHRPAIDRSIAKLDLATALPALNADKWTGTSTRISASTRWSTRVNTTRAAAL
jgi:hypothetical protein